MDFSDLFGSFGSLFEIYGYYSILLIAVVILLMTPINIVLKKVMNNQSTERLRKTVAYIAVYILSGVIIAVSSYVMDIGLSYNYVTGSALALGFCAQFSYEILKLVRDYGFNKVFNYIIGKIKDTNMINEISSKYNIDKNIIKFVINMMNIELDKDVDAQFTADSEFIRDLNTKLVNFVGSDNVTQLIDDISKLVK